ncbi:unnamed protein product [Aspergillus oryzae]|uniref:Unnamed protein product n=2 Tax=Aspergillus oryzae TaxID=5062 RepID=A0AAN4Y8K2_ASPOZ|nr:unnamed protein product [Aspergillus oryzae]GMF85186.1 unnamed protein product [Aspergillus oryzae]GMG05798.1 unnamed protein product [Aspergillus oryzae]GMG23043.1 unnamed protein product [Aspergillus oryzae]GMG43044.1 unnamed protein product [Aspergillus oryzae var. brunneus]
MFFLYPGDYDNNPSHEMTGGNSTSTETQTHHGDVMTSESRIRDEMYKHLRVYVTADMLGIDDLMKKISRNCLAWWVEN